jgi:Kinesin motor domain
VLECTSVEDMTAILNEGMKHRKIGSHELNKDSSRSHSILTIYLITEVKNPIKKLFSHKIEPKQWTGNKKIW